MQFVSAGLAGNTAVAQTGDSAPRDPDAAPFKSALNQAMQSDRSVHSSASQSQSSTDPATGTQPNLSQAAGQPKVRTNSANKKSGDSGDPATQGSGNKVDPAAQQATPPTPPPKPEVECPPVSSDSSDLAILLGLGVANTPATATDPGALPGVAPGNATSAEAKGAAGPLATTDNTATPTPSVSKVQKQNEAPVELAAMNPAEVDASPFPPDGNGAADTPGPRSATADASRSHPQEAADSANAEKAAAAALLAPAPAPAKAQANAEHGAHGAKAPALEASAGAVTTASPGSPGSPAQNSSSGGSPNSEGQFSAPSTPAGAGSSMEASFASQVNTGATVVAASTEGSSPASGQNGSAESHPSATPAPAETAHAALETEQPVLVTPRMLESVQQTEVRVGVHPEGMGPIEIRAVLRGDEVGAAISAQQPDTHQWLAAHLGELESTLHAHDIRLGQLTLNQLSGSGSLGSGYAQSESQGQGQRPYQSPTSFSPETPEYERAGGAEDENDTNLLPGHYVGSGLDLQA
jgi:hypothetical protein